MRMAGSVSDPVWYKDAILYELHVRAFFDSNGDGTGDFAGLIQKLDYLRDLGITCLWLLPFFPSPLKDDGYDISDFLNVHPSYGTIEDFKEFLGAAHERGLQVMIELVMNHTSDQHPWFQRARHAPPGSVERDFYVWSDTDQKYQDVRIIFTDTEKSNWTWDQVAQAYFWHRFFSHQPDLNYDNPKVVEEMLDVVRYWLDLGVDALRIDAIPYLVERNGTNCENLPETHAIVKRLRHEIDTGYANRMILAEANQWPTDVRPYFGEGDECHMAFHFPLMPRVYMALRQEDRLPITDIMAQTPQIPVTCQWGLFLRNHDELTLEMVTNDERDYMYLAYSADSRMRVNLGIRRRLAPLMDNNRRRIELLNSLLFSFPGTPILYYGDEIGMGDNVYLGDRDGVRTPMQWSFDRNGGFSRADPARLYLPPIMDPVYGFEAVNVEAQSRSPSSLLNWKKRLIGARRARRAFGSGTLRFLYPSNRKVIAYLREWEGETILCVANLSRSAQAVELDLAEFRGRRVIELLGRSVFPTIGEQPYLLTLQGHSFLWFELIGQDLPELAAMLAVPLPEFVTLVMPQGWGDLFSRHNLTQLEREVVPPFLPRQRWFGAKDRAVQSVAVLARGEIEAPAEFDAPPERFLTTVVEARLAGGERQRYLLPLAAAWSGPDSEVRQSLLPVTLAELRQVRREGALADAMTQDGFALAVLDAIRREAAIPLTDGAGHHGEIRFRRRPRFDSATIPQRPVVRRLGADQSNSSVLFEEFAVLKLYRRLNPGQHPEIEMTAFLAERAGFANVPQPLATAEILLPQAEPEEPNAVAVLFAFVRNQGDGWTLALDYLTRYLDDALIETAPGAAVPGRAGGLPNPHDFFVMLARQLGLRTAEMHRALAEHGHDDPAFAPEPLTPDDIAKWCNALDAAAEAMLDQLDRTRHSMPEAARELADRVISARQNLFRAIRLLLPADVAAAKTRCHGDLHLGQVIAVQNDFYIIDFEGEPLRTLAERRDKGSPLRDVAGMIRSFDYATTTAVRQLSESRPAAIERMTELADAWRQRAVDGFRAAYRKVMRDCPAYPANKLHARALIDWFTLEKAVYEVSYELANRPGWVAIPLNGILRMLAKVTGSPNGEAF